MSGHPGHRSAIRWQVAGILGIVISLVSLGISLAERSSGTKEFANTWASTESADTAAAALSAERRRSVAVIGDSYTAGTEEGGMGERGWPALVWRRLSEQGLSIASTVDATGGSGYVNPGPFGVTFQDAVDRTIADDDEVVVVFGGTNDVGLPVDELDSAARRALQTIHERAPSATLIVVGPVWPGPQPSAAALAADETLRQVAQSEGATYVDPIGEAWLADTPELIGADEVHPNDGGHRYLADRLSAVIDTALAEP
jgi:lysophospholipase L1-like esterase